MVFGEDRTLSNIPRPPSSRIRTAFWNPQQAQAQLNSLTAGGLSAQQVQQQISSVSRSINNNVHNKQQNQSSISPRRPSSAAFINNNNNNRSPSVASSSNVLYQNQQQMFAMMGEFRSQSVATPPSPMRKWPTVPQSFDASEEIMGNRTPSEYVKYELDTFEALKRRNLATTLEHDPRYDDLEVQELRLKKDKFASHLRDKEMIRLAGGKKNQRISDGFVNFRGRTYLKYCVPLESTMTRTMRWLFDLRELNVHPVTRMLREQQITVDTFSSEWLRVHIGTGNKEAGTSIPCDSMTKFLQEHALRTVYVTQAQCASFYELLCDKKGTSLDFAAAMTKLSLTLPPEIDDTISAWFTRMIFSGAYIMFRVGDNCTPAEMFQIVDALETLVDSSLKRGSVDHRLRDTPDSAVMMNSKSINNNNNSKNGGVGSEASASHKMLLREDEFSNNTPQGIMRLLSVVKADIEAYANAISTRAVRRVDDVLSMFSSESTLPRLMKCGEYGASNSKYHAMAMKRLHLAKQARERAISRSRSLLFGRRVSNSDDNTNNASGGLMALHGDDAA